MTFEQALGNFAVVTLYKWGLAAKNAHIVGQKVRFSIHLWSHCQDLHTSDATEDVFTSLMHLLHVYAMHTRCVRVMCQTMECHGNFEHVHNCHNKSEQPTISGTSGTE